MSRYYTPLRYPGGKQKLFSFINEIISTNNIGGIEYVEPYAGGAGIAIELLVRGVVSRIHLNDISKPVYAIWHTIITEPEWLCKKISIASLTVDEWLKQREVLKNFDNHSLEDLGFATLYLNRCNHSGILTGGIIGGLNQNGIWKLDARFSRKEIIDRIETIANVRSKISVTNFDAEVLIDKFNTDFSNKYFFYFDPPYLKKADRLYLNYYNFSDHARIADKIQSIFNSYWVVSYDNHDYISQLYNDKKKFVYDLQYNAQKAYQGKELFIFSDNLSVPVKSESINVNKVLNAFHNTLGVTRQL